MGADTIAALATAPGMGALAVIRISGPCAFRVFGECVAERERFHSAWDRRVGLYRLSDAGQVLDKVTAVRFAAPQSYTGEDMVEVTTHGGTIVPLRALSLFVRHGARHALPGEFTRRAVVAGKMDVLSAEAVNAIIHSAGVEEHTRAVRSYLGVQRHAFRELKIRLESLAAGLEAQMEFDIDGGIGVEDARRQLGEIREELAQELSRWERASERNRIGGAQVVLAGMANAGKSTLFNILLGRERAIVDSRAGTTRDYLVEPLVVGSGTVSLVDTAGFGSGGEALVELGIERTWRMLEDAEVVIWVSPQDSPNVSDEEYRLVEMVGERQGLVVASKADRRVDGGREGYVAGLGWPQIVSNLIDRTGQAHARAFVVGELERILGGKLELSLVANERHARGIGRVLEMADSVLGDGNAREDVIGSTVRGMVREVADVCGDGLPRGVLDDVFKTFCVGK